VVGISSSDKYPPTQPELVLQCAHVFPRVLQIIAVPPFFFVMSTFDTVSSGYGMQEVSEASEMDEGTNFSCYLSNLSFYSISNESHWKIHQNSSVTIVTGCIILIFFLVGFFWNLFIIVTLLVKHHLLKESGIVLLFNVAITDFFMCVTILPFAFVTAFRREFVFGDSDSVRCTMCSVSGFFLSFLMLVTLHLLCALSVDRFIVLSYPLRYKHIMNSKKALVICMFVYVLCFVLALLPHLGFGEIEFSLAFGSCVPRFSPINNLYYIILVGVEMCIPSIILAVTNVWTYKFASNFITRSLRRTSAYPRNQDMSGKNTQHQKQQAQLVRVFGAMLLANIFSYTPTIIMGFVAFILNLAGAGDPPPEAYIFAYICFLTYPVSHPIIESSFVKDLRYELTRAKKKIGRASSAFYHQTAQLVSVKNHQDETNTSMDNLSSPSLGSSAVRWGTPEDGARRSPFSNTIPAHSSSHLSPPSRSVPSNGFFTNGIGKRCGSSSPVGQERVRAEAGHSAVGGNNPSPAPTAAAAAATILDSCRQPDYNLANENSILEEGSVEESFFRLHGSS